MPVQYPELAEYLLDRRPPLEAQLIDFVDEIAYGAADLDDGYEAKYCWTSTRFVPRCLFLIDITAEVDRAKPPPEAARIEIQRSCKTQSWIIWRPTLIEHTRAAGSGIGCPKRRRRYCAIGHVGRVQPASMPRRTPPSRSFWSSGYTTIPPSWVIASSRLRPWASCSSSISIIPNAMPRSYTELTLAQSPLPELLCDYIAGMTDHYLLRQHAYQFGERLLAASSLN